MAESNPIVSEWIEKAEADWEWVGLAELSGNSKLRDGVVYHAQQCIEKLLKARLLQLGQSVRKIHDLSSPSRQLQVCDSSWQWDAEELDGLTDAGVLSRYPGFDTTQEEVVQLVDIASRLRAALLSCLTPP